MNGEVHESADEWMKTGKFLRHKNVTKNQFLAPEKKRSNLGKNTEK